MRKGLKIALVGAVAALFVGGTSSAAYADTYTSSCQNGGFDNGKDCTVNYYHGSTSERASEGAFYSYGEHLYAYDALADGRGVYVAVRWYDSSTGLNHFYEYKLTSGAGTDHDENLSMPEGTSVTFTACQTDNGSLLNCRNRTATA